MEEKKEVKLGVYGNLYWYECANPKCKRNPAVSNYPKNIESLRVPGLEGEYCPGCREEIELEKAKKDLNSTK